MKISYKVLVLIAASMLTTNTFGKPVPRGWANGKLGGNNSGEAPKEIDQAPRHSFGIVSRQDPKSLLPPEIPGNTPGPNLSLPPKYSVPPKERIPLSSNSEVVGEQKNNAELENEIDQQESARSDNEIDEQKAPSNDNQGESDNSAAETAEQDAREQAGSNSEGNEHEGPDTNNETDRPSNDQGGD